MKANPYLNQSTISQPLKNITNSPNISVNQYNRRIASPLQFNDKFCYSYNNMDQNKYLSDNLRQTNYQQLTKEYLNMRDKYTEQELIKLFEECEKEILIWKQKYEKEASMNQSLKQQIFEIMQEKRNVDIKINDENNMLKQQNEMLQADLEALQFKYTNDINLLENKFVSLEQSSYKKQSNQKSYFSPTQNYVTAQPQQVDQNRSQFAQRYIKSPQSRFYDTTQQQQQNNVLNFSFQNSRMPNADPSSQNEFIEKLLQAGNAKEHEITLLQNKINILEQEYNDKLFKLNRDLEMERKEKTNLYLKVSDNTNETSFLESSLTQAKAQVCSLQNDLIQKENIIQDLKNKLDSTEINIQRMSDEYMKHLEHVYQVSSITQENKNEELIKVREHLLTLKNEQQPILMQLQQEKIERLRYLEKLGDMIGSSQGLPGRNRIKEHLNYGPYTDTNQLSAVNKYQKY